jgi:hypothetical protein
VWGSNSNGQLGLGDFNNRLIPTSNTLEDVVSIQGGANHTVFLTNNNEVFTSGGNGYGQLGLNNQNNSNTPKKVDISGVDMISASQYSTLLKRFDHSVFGFGGNAENQLLPVLDTTILVPSFISSLEGVTFIEASRISSHFIYGEQNTCISNPLVTEFLPSPDVSIIADGDTLASSETGSSYQWYFNGNIISGQTNQTIVANSTGTYSVEVIYANGCSSTSNNYYHSTIGIKETQAGRYKLFPNPANDAFQIELIDNGDSFKVILIDNLGKEVYQNEFNSSKATIQTSEFDNGVYYLKIINNRFEIIEKLVINH